MDTALDPPPAPPPAPPRPPRLTRNTSERVLGGVAAGIADHFGVSPLLVRLAFVVATFFGGIGVIAYVVAWIVLPSATPGAPPAPRDNRQLLGFGLVAVGLATIPNGFGFGWSLDGAFWPLALVTLGAAVLWLRTRDDRDADDDQPTPAPPPTPSAPPATPAPPVSPAGFVATPPTTASRTDTTAPLPPEPPQPPDVPAPAPPRARR